MKLAPRQLSSLEEMGVPVWELRARHQPVIPQENEEKPQDICCWVLVENKKIEVNSQRLIQSILFSIGLDWNQSAIITADQLSTVKRNGMKQKLLLVLGESLAQSLWGITAVRGQMHHDLGDDILTVVMLDTDTLLENPEKKSLVWQDVKLIKSQNVR